MRGIRTLQDLVDRIAPRLRLHWFTPPPGPSSPFQSEDRAIQGQSPVGSLNCIHPNRIQVIGPAECRYLEGLGETACGETLDKLFSNRPAAILFTDHISPPPTFFRRARAGATALLGTTAKNQEVIEHLQHFLTHELAERTIVHGVFMEVLGAGVLLVGDPAVGKSELALELINRGHRLIADDTPEFAHIAPEVLEGSSPPLLRYFLEVRGLGILNIQAMFGEGAIEERKPLNLIVNLRTLGSADLAEFDRLSGSLRPRSILGVTVPEITMPVAPGRNLAVLVEAAVRTQILRMRGYDAGVDLSARQAQALRDDEQTET